MKIRFTDGSGAKVERDCASWREVIDAVRRHLETVDDTSLRRGHTCALKRIYSVDGSGPQRMGMAGMWLKPIEEEMRRRGMYDDRLTKHKLRIELACTERRRRELVTKYPDWAAELDRRVQVIGWELQFLD